MASNLLKTFGERSSYEIQRVLKEELRNFSSTQKDLIHKLYCDWETKMPGSREKNKLLLELVDHCKNGCLISSSYHPDFDYESSKAKRPKKDAKSRSDSDDELLKGFHNYSARKVLGKGTFGKVILAEKVGLGELVAIKVIDRRNIKTSKQNTSVTREIKLMKLLDHPHIIGVKEIIEEKNHVLLVMEHAGGGELFDYILNHGFLEEKEARRIFRQIVSAVDYCHQNSVIHRDLKPENLLLDSNKNVKLIDFGFGNTFHKDRLLDTFCGSPFYAAPEMIQGIKYIGPEVDVWSLGVILYTLLSGRLPFDGSNLNELYDNIASGRYKIPDTITGDAIGLIQKMLEVDPKRRATLFEIKHHSWINRDYIQPVKNYINPERSALVPNPNIDSLRELVSYGFKEEDCKNILANNNEQHPIKSLYYLIDEARIKENKKKLAALSSTSVTNEPITLNTEQSHSSLELESTPKKTSKAQVAPCEKGNKDHVIINVASKTSISNDEVENLRDINTAFDLLEMNDEKILEKSNGDAVGKIKGFFVVSTSSTRKFHEITFRIEFILKKHNIEFKRPRFNDVYDCIDAEKRPTHKFQIEIKELDAKKVKAYKIEMKRVKGGIFEHSKLCRKLIQEMDL